MKRDEAERLEDISEAIRRIRDIAADDPARAVEATSRDAMLYNLVIIGEAVKHLSEDTRRRAPDIPWRRIAGLRDLLTHEYFRIEIDAIQKIIDRDLGPLERAIQKLRPPTDPEASSEG